MDHTHNLGEGLRNTTSSSEWWITDVDGDTQLLPDDDVEYEDTCDAA